MYVCVRLSSLDFLPLSLCCPFFLSLSLVLFQSNPLKRINRIERNEATAKLPHRAFSLIFYWECLTNDVLDIRHADRALGWETLLGVSLPNTTLFTVTLAGKGEESPSASSAPLLSLIFSSSIPSLSNSPMTARTEVKLSPIMSNETSTRAERPSSTAAKFSDESTADTTTEHLPPSTRPRRLPLPKKLSLEQNLTNLIEKESPMLQAELLTAEHELSVLRSRLAVNEGVTAITGTILESLRGQLEPRDQIISANASLDPPERTSSTMHVTAKSKHVSRQPESVEIHYDAQLPQSPYLVLRAINCFWIAQPIDDSEVQQHLKRFSSPVMKRATIEVPESFSIDSDSDEESIVRASHESRSSSTHSPKRKKNTSMSRAKISTNIDAGNNSDDSISDADERSTIDRQEQLREMRTIRSSSIIQSNVPDETFDEQQFDAIHAIITRLKASPSSAVLLNGLATRINELKLVLARMNSNQSDEIRLDYELEDLMNRLLHDKTDHVTKLFDENLDELQRFLQHVEGTHARSQPANLIADFEEKLEYLDNISASHQQSAECIPPTINSQGLASTSSPTQPGRASLDSGERHEPDSPPSSPVPPEGTWINAACTSSDDDDDTDALHHRVQPAEVPVHSANNASLESQGALHSSERRHKGGAALSPSESSSPAPSIDHLRAIMSELMLAASWTKDPLKGNDDDDEEEMLAESFITTEQRNCRSAMCEIIHEIEHLPLAHVSGNGEAWEPRVKFPHQASIVIYRHSSNRQDSEHEQDPACQEQSTRDETDHETWLEREDSIGQMSSSLPMIDERVATRREMESQHADRPSDRIDSPVLIQSSADRFENGDDDDERASEQWSRSSSDFGSLPTRTDPSDQRTQYELERDLSDENFLALQSSSLPDESYCASADYHMPTPFDSTVISRVQRSSIISKTIKCWSSEEHEENDPSTLAASPYNQLLLLQTSTIIVDNALHDAVKETIAHEQNQLLHQTAVRLVDDVLTSVLAEPDGEATVVDLAASSSDDDEYQSHADLSSDEENETLIPRVSDQPYLFATDVVTSTSTQELGTLVHELQTLEQRIPYRYSVSSSSSSSDESNPPDDTNMPQMITKESVNELSNLVSELEEIEEQLENRFDPSADTFQSSKSFNELGGLIHELNTVTRRFSNCLHERIFTSSNIDALSHDIAKYRRDSVPSLDEKYTHSQDRQPSSPPSSPILEHDVTETIDDEQTENQIVHDLIDTVLKQAQDIVSEEVSVALFNRRVLPSAFLVHLQCFSHALNIDSDDRRRSKWGTSSAVVQNQCLGRFGTHPR